MTYPKLASMKKKLVIIGGGGHCRTVIDSVCSLSVYSEIVITDPNISVGEKINGYSVVGGDEVLYNLYDNGYDSAFIAIGAIGDTDVRRKLDKIVTDIGYKFPIIVDASATIALNCMIADGTYIAKNACVNSSSSIGRNAIINTGAIVEHDCNIGDYVHIAVGAVVCGGCNIGHDVFIGANATVIQGVTVGENSIIGAGSTVLADVPANTTVVGVFSRGGGSSSFII